jgi:hypothetical protein
MKNIKFFDLTVGGTVLRFFAMMAVVIIVGFTGHFILAALIGFVIAITSILGMHISSVPLSKGTAVDL